MTHADLWDISKMGRKHQQVEGFRRCKKMLSKNALNRYFRHFCCPQRKVDNNHLKNNVLIFIGPVTFELTF
jgi:hypothetical protein